MVIVIPVAEASQDGFASRRAVGTSRGSRCLLDRKPGKYSRKPGKYCIYSILPPPRNHPGGTANQKSTISLRMTSDTSTDHTTQGRRNLGGRGGMPPNIFHGLQQFFKNISFSDAYFSKISSGTDPRTPRQPRGKEPRGTSQGRNLAPHISTPSDGPAITVVHVSRAVDSTLTNTFAYRTLKLNLSLDPLCLVTR